MSKFSSVSKVHKIQYLCQLRGSYPLGTCPGGTVLSSDKQQNCVPGCHLSQIEMSIQKAVQLVYVLACTQTYTPLSRNSRKMMLALKFCPDKISWQIRAYFGNARCKEGLDMITHVCLDSPVPYYNTYTCKKCQFTLIGG